MSSKVETVFDLESDGFLNKVSKVWVVSYQEVGMDAPVSLLDYQDISEFFSEDRTFIGHNIISYDFKVVKKIMGVPQPPEHYDTLPLARSLMPGRSSYGLDSFGDKYGIPKPKVTDWSEQPIEVYINRCEEDVKINMALWMDLRRKLGELYETPKR